MGLFVVAAVSGILAGQGAPARGEVAGVANQGFEARLIELGLTENQIEDTIVQGVEVFIERQQQAQRDAQRQQQSAAAAQLRPVSAQDDFIRGAETATFSMIEYSDFECPFCKRFHDTAVSFTANNTNVNWVHRHFPLPNHNPAALQAAAGAECLGLNQGAEEYWAFTDQYYQATQSGGRGMADGSVVDMMVMAGMAQEAAVACLNDPEVNARIELQMAEGQAAGVTGTPGIFIRHNPSGQVLRIPGAVPLPEIQGRFDQFRANL